METGDYNQADKYLSDVALNIKDKGDDELKAGKNYFLTLIACKYYHIQAKNFNRAYYF
jgi:hypothetical protein